MTDVSYQSQPQEAEASLGDYFALLKPRVMQLVVFTAVVGLLAAPAQVHPVIAFASILFVAIGAGASGALNMWWDADIDGVMRRTSKRPIPAGKVTPDEAKVLGFALSGMSVMMLALSANMLAAFLLAFTIFFYLVIYSMWLKRLTPQNIVIGGAAGAFPPVIGWVIATGSMSIEPWLMFALIFMWTPPHFWALSLFSNEDYKRANIPMMTVTAGSKSTKIQMMLYTSILVPLTLLPSVLGFASATYGAIAAGLGLLFIVSNIRVLMHKDLKHAKIMFGYSVFYLFALFLALMIG